MAAEASAGPDPLGRPPLPRRRPDASSGREIVIRPPLPRRKPRQAETLQRQSYMIDDQDPKQRQLSEAVEVIAKSAERTPGRREDKRTIRPTLTLKEASQAQGSESSGKKSKGAVKTNQKMIPKQAAPVVKPQESSSHKRTQADKPKLASSSKKEGKPPRSIMEPGSKSAAVVLQPRADARPGPRQADSSSSPGQTLSEPCQPNEDALWPVMRITPTRATIVNRPPRRQSQLGHSQLLGRLRQPLAALISVTRMCSPHLQ